MTIIHLLQRLLLTAAVMTNFPESKSLAQAKNKSTCGIRRLDAFDMMLTCFFHDNISSSRKDFTVYLYKGGIRPKMVLSCDWSPDIFCHVDPGYKYEYDIDVHHDHTNVRILHVNADHVGTYTCQVTGESEPGTCSLTEEQTNPNVSPLNPYTELTFKTTTAQTATPTSLLPDNRQTQSAGEQSSVASELADTKDAREGKLAEEHRDTGSQDNTVIYIVLSIIFILVVIILTALYCKRRLRSRTVRKGIDRQETHESIQLMSNSHADDCHNEISPPIPGAHEDCQTAGGQLMVRGEDKQQTRFTENQTVTDDKANVAGADKLVSRQEQTNQSVPRNSGDTTCCSPANNSEECGRQQGPEEKTRSEEDGDSCHETATKPLIGEPSDLVEKTGVQERGDVDIQDDERNVDGSHLD